ncbi:MAG: SDR family NAD(P)-dependent oxidoreductase [Alistipes sp.]|nr:SDR family NAD(P)-dependent oxidoreductase [Alistipes sp.]
MRTTENTVLITGGATGIGFALAGAFLERGNTVIICGRREEKLLEAQRKLPGLKIRVCDVTDPSGRQDLTQWTENNFPEINILVNNAGIQRHIDFTVGADQLHAGENEIRVNLEAPVFLSAMFIPLLSVNRDAAIVNVSSGLGFFPAVGMPVYSATKAALHMFSVTLRQQLAPTGIRVFEAIAPYIPDTELNLEGRKRSGVMNLNHPAPTAAQYAEVVLEGIGADQYEIGYGMTDRWRTMSRAELDQLVTK